MKKRLLASLLAAAMTLTMAPAAFAAETAELSNSSTSSVTTTQEDSNTLQYKINHDTTVVKLDKDREENITIAKDQDVTIDLNGKTLTVPGDQGIRVYGSLKITGNGTITCKDTPVQVDGGNLTIENGTITSENAYGIYALNSGSVTVNGGMLTANYAVLCGNKTTGDMNFEINGGTLTSKLSEAIYMLDQQELTVKGGVINGGISARMGRIDIFDGTINGMTSAQNADSMKDYDNPSGSARIGDAIYILGGTYTSENEFYGNATQLFIFGGTINGKAHRAIAVYDIGSNSDQDIFVNIIGDDTKVSGDVVIDDTYGSHKHKVDTDFRISGGYYTMDVSKMCSNPWTAIPNTDPETAKEYKYVVESLVDKIDESQEVTGETIKGQTDVSVSDDIDEKDIQSATAVANTVDSTEQLIDSDGSSFDNYDKSSAIAALKNLGAIKFADGKITNGKEVTIIKKPYLYVTVEEYTISESSNDYKISLDITPRYDLIATTDKEHQDENNTVQFVNGQKMTITTRTEVTVTLPKEFAGKLVYINHNDKNLYTATADENGKITFVTDGFSPFTFTLTKPSIFNTSSGGSSGGSSSKTTYKVTTSSVANGGVNVSPSSPAKGDKVKITLSPNKGYKLDKLTVTDASGKTVSTTKTSDTVYTFTMPASQVTVGVTYVKADETTEQPSTKTFSDVSSSDWFADAVKYVSDKGMMNGTGTGKFSPADSTTRAMLMTVIARYAGQDTTGSNPWYQKSMEWAKANGVSDGTAPNANITREQLVTMLYRYAKSTGKDVSVGKDTNILSYADATTVSEYAVPAMQWACGAGIVNGANGKLNPQNNATRAEVAAILMRFCENVK